MNSQLNLYSGSSSEVVTDGRQSLKSILLVARDSGCLTGKLKFDVPLAAYTSWRIGGNAECFYQPEDSTDLQAVLQHLPEHTPIYWIGLGSNLLVRDGGVKGLVINTNGVLNKLEIQCADSQLVKEKACENAGDTGTDPMCIMTAQAGVACAIFSRKAAHYGIKGAEFLSGIPGTMGGALAMNAGAFGGATWNQLLRVEIINQAGEIMTRTADQFHVQYRKVELKEAVAKENKGKKEWFLSGTFCFERDEQGLMQNKSRIRQLLKQRAETQPTKQANAGSVFKNPDNDYAARLIESCGLKGKSVNDAQISEKHANFIINKGHARAEDVESLIAEIKAKVLLKYQIKLETEVKIIGENALAENIKR